MIRGENFDPDGDNQVWVDGHLATVLSSTANELRVGALHPEVRETRGPVLTVVSGNRASNGYAIEIVPPGAFEAAHDLFLGLSDVTGSALLDVTPGEERLLVLDRSRGIFEVGRENASLRHWRDADPFGEATAIARNPDDGRIYVAYSDGAETRIITLSDEGEATLLYVESGRPVTAMAFEATGKLLVAFEGMCTLWEFDEEARSGESVDLGCGGNPSATIHSLATSEDGFLATTSNSVMGFKWKAYALAFSVPVASAGVAHLRADGELRILDSSTPSQVELAPGPALIYGADADLVRLDLETRQRSVLIDGGSVDIEQMAGVVEMGGRLYFSYFALPWQAGFGTVQLDGSNLTTYEDWAFEWAVFAAEPGRICHTELTGPVRCFNPDAPLDQGKPADWEVQPMPLGYKEAVGLAFDGRGSLLIADFPRILELSAMGEAVSYPAPEGSGFTSLWGEDEFGRLLVGFGSRDERGSGFAYVYR